MYPPTFFFNCNQNVEEMQNFSGLSGLGFIQQRKREFVQYMSIGMTEANIRKMFSIEALVIAGRPLLITLPLTVVFVIVGVIAIKRDEYLTNKAKRKSSNSDIAEVETSAVINWSMTSDTDKLNIRIITTYTLDRLRDICINFRNNVYHEASDLGHNTSYQKYYKDWLKSQTLLINAEVIKSMAESEADHELLRRNLYIDPDNQITFNTLLNIDATYNALRQFADKAKSDEANSIKPNN